MFADIPVIWKQ